MYLNPITIQSVAEIIVFSAEFIGLCFFITSVGFEYLNYAAKNTTVDVQISFNFQFLLNVPALAAIGLALLPS